MNAKVLVWALNHIYAYWKVFDVEIFLRFTYIMKVCELTPFSVIHISWERKNNIYSVIAEWNSFQLHETAARDGVECAACAAWPGWRQLCGNCTWYDWHIWDVKLLLLFQGVFVSQFITVENVKVYFKYQLAQWNIINVCVKTFYWDIWHFYLFYAILCTYEVHVIKNTHTLEQS